MELTVTPELIRTAPPFIRRMYNIPQEQNHARIPPAEAFFINLKRHSGLDWIEDYAEVLRDSYGHYNGKDHRVYIRPLEYFDSPDSFYRVLAHEAVHWTQHKIGRTECERTLHTMRQRVRGLDDPESDLFRACDREVNKAFAREELVAEIGASHIMRHLGLQTPVNIDFRDRYLARVADQLHDLDPGSVSRHFAYAEPEARRAADYLIGLQP